MWTHESGHADAADARVFIIEDEALISIDLECRVSDLGYRVVGTAARGEHAIQRVAETLPDVILMDINLAGTIDGIETAARILAEREIPIVFVTALSDSDTLGRIGRLQHAERIGKPFRTEEIASALHRALT